MSVSGPSAKASEEDQEQTRRLADAEMHRHHLESLLDQRDREITALREVNSLQVVFMLCYSSLIKQKGDFTQSGWFLAALHLTDIEIFLVAPQKHQQSLVDRQSIEAKFNVRKIEFYK